eukprot:CAMPEP_0113491816 /NCGR_PEP_ID=MMETSP0014_2-20120614/27750_1 /TAXON_ID=2857 /ORGANISM="Nitzschia sp." /LENGTH=781 /DNA_ID=CAMNT_0000385617 /DNA_START=330 /DNA_END=2675 /DNA_ORIENTATION=+ /assembly_acc=CAM_ASM_000159
MTPSTNASNASSSAATSTKKGLIRRLQHGYGMNGSLFAVASNDETSSPLLPVRPVEEEHSTTKENSKSTTTNWTVTAATIAVATARAALSYISCQHGGQSRRRLRCCISGANDGSTSEGGVSEQQPSTSLLLCHSRIPPITMVSQTTIETVNFMLALISSSSSSTTADDSDTSTTVAASPPPLGDFEEQIEERWQPTVLTSSSSSSHRKQEILPLTMTRSTMVNNDEVTESTSSWSSFSATPAKTSSPLTSSTNRKKNFVAQGEEKQEEKSSTFLPQQQKYPKNNMGSATKAATDINTEIEKDQDDETDNRARPIKIEPINDQGGEADDDLSSLILKDYTCSRVELLSLPPPPDFDNITFRTSGGDDCRSNHHNSPNNIQYYDDDDSVERMFKQRKDEAATNMNTTTTAATIDIKLNDDKVAEAAQSDCGRVRFYIRIPIRTDESLAQARRERLERAERTADFMDIAKTLSLRLSRDSWSGRSSSLGSFSSTHPAFRRHRSRSMDSTSDYASTAESSVSNSSQGQQLTQQHQQLLQAYRRASAGCGVNPIPRRQKLRRSSMDALPRRRSSMGAVPRRRSSLQAMPRRRSSNGFGGTPFSRPPLSRQNSSESLHRLLKQEMEKNGIPPAPLLISPTNAETHTVSMNAIENMSESDSFKVKEALGYEDIDETLHTQNVGGEEKVSQTSVSHQRSSMSSMYSSSTSTSQYGYEDNRTTTPAAAAGGTGASGVDQQQQTRQNRHHRTQRRGSLVASSKIERYDDNANKRKKQRRRSSIQMQMFQG